MLLATLVFVVAFGLAIVVLAASGVGGSKDVKEAMARLNSILIADPKKSAEEDLLDIRKKELLSTIPLLNRLLLELDVTPKLRRLLYQANLQWTPAAVILMCLLCWVIPGYLIYARTGAGLMALLLGALGGALPIGYVLSKRAKRFDEFEQGLPAAIDLMVSGLRGGHSLVSALGLVGRETADPIGREFRTCFDEQNYGLDLHTAMENLVTRIPIQDVRIITTAMLIQKETGGNLAEVLDKCAQVIRDRFRLRREIRVKTTQGRMTGWILSLLPVVLGCALYMVNPKNMSVLWTRDTGRHMLYGAAVMTLTGALIIRKIVRIRV